MNTVTAHDLRQMLLDDEELALLDAREEGTFHDSHLFYASCCALSRLERLAPRLVPRRSTRVVVCDAGAGEAERAATLLGRHGYSDVSVLAGGIDAWAAAGYTLVSGVNVPSKAHGEVIEHELDTPAISAEALHAMIAAGEDIAILDSRPTPEFTNFSIPGGVCCPGAELAYRVHDAVPSPETTIVVNCAGRTRSIIGAQSLINGGVPNRVVSLRNGTMGWHLAGLEVARGATEHAARPSAAGLEKARASAARVAERFDVRTIDSAVLERWRAESGERSLFVFDVRTREEYVDGHLPDARWIAGGQLVQTTDEQVGALRSRIVVVDDDGVRATMTASWLVQMGWRDAVVLEGGIEGHALETGMPAAPVLGLDEARVENISPDALATALERAEVEVVDTSLSRSYRSGHLPGARHAIRARLGRNLANRLPDRLLVVTADDEAIARLAAADLTRELHVPVRCLDGGNRGWVAAGYPMTAADPIFLDDPDDVRVRVNEDEGGMEQAMNDYLTWEIGLVDDVARDGTAAWLHMERMAR